MPTPDNKTQNRIYQVLRIAMSMCLIGHGAFGIITKPIWLNYFAVFGIGHDLGYHMMPVMGSIDILMGMVVLIFPVRAIALWLVFWGFVTALLRPLSGEPFAEVIERAGNFGVPLAFLMLTGLGSTFRDWFTVLKFRPQTDTRYISILGFVLKGVVFLLLAGHGWLNIIEKKALLSQYASLGFSNPATIARIVGSFEIVCALAVFIKPVPSLLLFLLIWKATTELFYPHYAIFEWVERGGSYGSILALYFLVQSTGRRNVFSRPGPHLQPHGSLH